MIRQLSDKDAVTVEIIKGITKLIAASMYFDREIQIENDLEKMERVLLHAKNTGVLIASDTNARSALWNDRVTNERGRILEEFITTKQLYYLNEESSENTSSNSIGKSNIDLTIINPQLLSCIILYCIILYYIILYYIILYYIILYYIILYYIILYYIILYYIIMSQ